MWTEWKYSTRVFAVLPEEDLDLSRQAEVLVAGVDQASKQVPDIRILWHAHVCDKELEDIERHDTFDWLNGVFQDEVLDELDDEPKHSRDLFVEHVGHLVVWLEPPTKLVHEVRAVSQNQSVIWLVNQAEEGLEGSHDLVDVVVLVHVMIVE